MGPDKVYGGEIGEGDGGDDEQHGGRKEEDNTGDAERSGRHGGLRGRGRHELEFISCDFIRGISGTTVTSRTSIGRVMSE